MLVFSCIQCTDWQFLKKKCTLLSAGLSCLVFAFLPAHSLFKGKPSGALVVMSVLRFVINKHHVLKTLHRHLNTTSVLNVAAQLGQITELFFQKNVHQYQLAERQLKMLYFEMMGSFLAFLSSNQIQSLPQQSYTCEFPCS